MTVNIRHILHAAWLRLTLCVATLAVLCVLVSCSDDTDDDGSRTVVLRFSTAQATGVTRAGTATASTAKDDAVKDLTVLIFDSKGNVIGSNYGSYTIESSTSFSVSIKTHVAQGCTVYAFANVGTLINSDYFYGLSTKSEIDSKVYKLKDNNELSTQPCLLMKGELSPFDTDTKVPTEVPLQRLASKFDFTITAKNDATNGSLPITIDGYQLFNVPSSTSLAKASSTVPSSYHNDASETEVKDKTSSASADATVTFSTYMYGNPVGSNERATDWKQRNKNNLPDGKTCTYLRIYAHTAVWSSYYDVYLGGKELTASGSTPDYDYADYTIYPNTHYTVGITIQGSGAEENGLRVNYKANIMFNGATLNGWGKDVPIDTDMK